LPLQPLLPPGWASAWAAVPAHAQENALGFKTKLRNALIVNKPMEDELKRLKDAGFDGVEGFIVRGRDPAHIAQAMIRLAEDRELNCRMGEAARQKGAVRNTWQDYGDRLLAEYQARLKKQEIPVSGGCRSLF
jgi:hypothetical protein